MTTASKKFKLEISLDNDAFKPEACIEIAQILRGVANDLEENGDALSGDHIFDANGNKVGHWARI